MVSSSSNICSGRTVCANCVKRGKVAEIVRKVYNIDNIRKKPATNLMSLALLFHYLMLNMFRMLIHPSSAGACDLFVELFHGLYCSGSMCVGIMLWFGCGGVVSGCGLMLNMLRIK